MMPTLQLTHDAAARIYQGPRYRSRRTRLTPQHARQALHAIAGQFQKSFNPWIIGFGHKIERWLKRKAQRV